MRKIFSIIYFIFPLLIFCFNYNEKLEFDLKYGIIHAGSATLEVDTLSFRKEYECLSFTSTAKTNSFFDKIFRVRDSLQSIWEIKNKEALRFTKKLREGNYRQYRVHHYYPDINKTVYLKFGKGNKIKRVEMDIPDDTQDILSAFYLFRAKEISVGDSIYINVTVDGDNYPALVLVHSTEEVESIFGKKVCFKIEPVLRGVGIFKQTGNIFIYLTKDKYKIPVLLESKVVFGHFRAVLKGINVDPYK